MSTTELVKLASTVARHTKSDGNFVTSVPGLMLYRSSSPTGHDAAVYEPSLVVVVQGSKEVILGNETYRYNPAQSLLVSVDLPVSARVIEASSSRPCLALRISLDAATVGELLARGISAPPIGSPTRGLAVTRVEPPLLDAVTRSVALLDSPLDISALAPLVLREITYRLLTGPQGARPQQIASAGAPAQRIVTAIRWLKAHFADPLRIESLAKKVRMSPSAFHLHFKEVTAMSPLQNQNRLRIQAARRLMLGEGLDAAERRIAWATRVNRSSAESIAVCAVRRRDRMCGPSRFKLRRLTWPCLRSHANTPSDLAEG